jgi:hypothetical protein
VRLAFENSLSEGAEVAGMHSMARTRGIKSYSLEFIIVLFATIPQSSDMVSHFKIISKFSIHVILRF